MKHRIKCHRDRFGIVVGSDAIGSSSNASAATQTDPDRRRAPSETIHGHRVSSQSSHEQNKLFHLTRWRLALWYGVVMGFILGLCGLGYTRRLFTPLADLDRELSLLRNADSESTKATT